MVIIKNIGLNLCKADEIIINGDVVYGKLVYSFFDLNSSLIGKIIYKKLHIPEYN